VQLDNTIRDLKSIRRIMPSLNGQMGTRRPPRPRREPTPEVLQARYDLWIEERHEVQLGIHGRGASPAPCDLDAAPAAERIRADILDLADHIASAAQAPPDPDDPRAWHYAESWRHGIDWAITWIVGRLEDGVSPATLDYAASRARSILRTLEAAIQGERALIAGVCACGERLTVAVGDLVIVCPECGRSTGPRQWMRLALSMGARGASAA
jgi:hypothetical protein